MSETPIEPDDLEVVDDANEPDPVADDTDHPDFDKDGIQ